MDIHRVETGVVHFRAPVTDEDRRREAETKALRRQITEENPGYWDRLADCVRPTSRAIPSKSKRLVRDDCGASRYTDPMH